MIFFGVNSMSVSGYVHFNNCLWNYALIIVYYLTYSFKIQTWNPLNLVEKKNLLNLISLENAIFPSI